MSVYLLDIMAEQDFDVAALDISLHIKNYYIFMLL